MSTPDVSGEQLTNQFSELQNADPERATKILGQIKTMLVSLYMTTVFQVPEAARHVASAQKEIDQALKAIQQAAATLNAVRPQIANRAALPPGFGPGNPGASQMPETGGIGGM